MIVGPTGSGKSDVAMSLAGDDAHVEIVAVDSMQVYRRMDIGTGKPSDADRLAVTHHCLDLVDPAEEFTVTGYLAAADAAIAAIDHRRHRPVLVAGTGLYLRAVIDRLQVPPQDPEVSLALHRRAEVDGPAALHAELSQLDPIAAARIEPNNTRRVVRALEVTLATGRPFSSFGPGLEQYPPTRWQQVGLHWPRHLLRARIAGRVERMIASGLLDEVAALHAGPVGRTARQALGYKELFEHLDGLVSLDEAVATTILRTQQYAVRQERWFRRDPRIEWISVEGDPVSEVRSRLTEMEATDSE